MMSLFYVLSCWHRQWKNFIKLCYMPLDLLSFAWGNFHFYTYKCHITAYFRFLWEFVSSFVWNSTLIRHEWKIKNLIEIIIVHTVRYGSSNFFNFTFSQESQKVRVCPFSLSLQIVQDVDSFLKSPCSPLCPSYLLIWEDCHIRLRPGPLVWIGGLC
jgi:hypothetical protein